MVNNINIAHMLFKISHCTYCLVKTYCTTVCILLHSFNRNITERWIPQKSGRDVLEERGNVQQFNGRPDQF